MRRLSIVASVLCFTACSGNNGSSSSDGTGGAVSGSGGAVSGAGGSTGSGGHLGSGGAVSGTGGATSGGSGGTTSGGSGGAVSGSGGATSGGAGGSGAGGSTGSGGHLGSGGAVSGTGGRTGAGGTAGTAGGTGGAGGVPNASGFSCNLVLGIDSTSEWFTGGFETEVDNTRWEIIYYHPGYVGDWADPSDAVWSVATTSACTSNAANPDRVIFNGFADPADTTYTNAAGWVSGLTKVVENVKKKYSRLKRIDLLTMTRAPNNQPCVAGNRMSVVETYVDDAIQTVVAAYPGLVTASPKFYAPTCDVFMSGGPHFTDAGKPIVAKVYGDYYSTEP